MSTTSWSLPPSVGSGSSVASVSLYNAFHAALRAAILSAGWVQTSDTGQVDFSTNATATLEGSSANYTIYRMDDAFQATHPVFLKVYHGYSTASAIVFGSLHLEVGFATNGSGLITGDVTPLMYVRTGTSGSSTAHTSFSSGGTNRLWICLHAYVTSTNADSIYQSFFAIERSKDATGADTGDFVTVLATGTLDVFRQVSLHRNFGATLAENRWMSPFPYNSTLGSFGTSGGTFPVFPALGRIEPPLLTVAVFKRGDFPNASNTTINAYGNLRTYKAFSCTTTNIASSAAVSTAAGNSAILALWE